MHRARENGAGTWRHRTEVIITSRHKFHSVYAAPKRTIIIKFTAVGIQNFDPSPFFLPLIIMQNASNHKVWSGRLQLSCSIITVIVFCLNYPTSKANHHCAILLSCGWLAYTTLSVINKQTTWLKRKAFDIKRVFNLAIYLPSRTFLFRSNTDILSCTYLDLYLKCLILSQTYVSLIYRVSQEEGTKLREGVP